MVRISSAANRALSGTTTAPVSDAAHSSSSTSGTLGERTTTRLPSRTPLVCR